MKLKETLNLGKTAFPMRAGLPNKEPLWQKEWEDANMYQRRQELNQGKPHFTLHDGPPYANGNIHVGHAMNKISKVSMHLIFLDGILMGFQSNRFWLKKV